MCTSQSAQQSESEYRIYYNKYELYTETSKSFKTVSLGIGANDSKEQALEVKPLNVHFSPHPHPTNEDN